MLLITFSNCYFTGNQESTYINLFVVQELGILTFKMLTSLLKPDFSENGNNRRMYEQSVYAI